MVPAIANDAHEQRLKALVAETGADVPVSLSSEILPEFREYERTRQNACTGGSAMHFHASRHETDYLLLVSRVREGIPVADAIEIMHSWRIPGARFAKVIGVSERKWSRVRTKASSEVLSPVESDRLVRVWRIFEHAKSVFAGDEDGKGAVGWFATPNPALSGETPLSLLDTDAGVRQVDDVLTRIEFGVYG